MLMKSYLTVSPGVATNKEECDTRSLFVGRRTESLRRTLPRVTVCYLVTAWLLVTTQMRNVAVVLKRKCDYCWLVSDGKE